MRLFTAVNLPDDAKNYIFELENKLNDKKIAKVKWTAKKNIHLTLKFFGEILDDNVQHIAEKLKDIKCNKFEVKINKIGAYPDENNIRVIWAGVEPENDFIKLQKLIDAETIAYGDFKPGGHITIGRVRFIKNNELLKEKLKSTEVEDLSFEINSFCLFSSELTKDGPEYSLLKSYELE